MRGMNKVELLPAAARKKLAEIELQRMQAEDAARGAAGRWNSLPPDADELRERLARERDRHAERHRALSLLVSRLNQFCMELKLPANSTLEVAPALELKLKASETVVAAVEAVRAQIANMQREIAAVRALPMRRASELEAIRAHLARLAQRSPPKVGFDARGNATVRWIEDMATMDGVLGLLAFVLGPEPLSAAFARDLAPEGAGAVSPLEREARLAELSASLLALERCEEQLIVRAADEGVELLRRGDADPRAVLNVAVVAKEAQAAA